MGAKRDGLGSHLSRGLLLGRRHRVLPDRRRVRGGRQGREHLGPLRPHPGPGEARRHRRLRLRLLPPLRRGRRDPPRPRPAELPLLDRVAAHPADRARAGPAEGRRLLPPPRRRAARRRHPAAPDALPLGPAPVPRGRRRLAEPRHREPLRRLRGDHGRSPRRPRLRLDRAERAAHLHDPRLPARRPRARAARPRRLPARDPHGEPRPGRGRARDARDALGPADRDVLQHVALRARHRFGRRRRRRRALARLHEHLVPRDRAARPLPRRIPERRAARSEWGSSRGT